MTTTLQITGHRDQLFNESVRQKLDKWISKYPPGQSQSALIPALHLLQDAHDGWLSEGLMRALAEYLDIAAISVFEVATFYTMFELKPVGKHKLSVCTNISCLLCGSEEIAKHIQKRLGIDFGQTTADGKFTLKEAECLGACVGAPMLLLDRDYHEHLTPAKIDALLDEIK